MTRRTESAGSLQAVVDTGSEFNSGPGPNPAPGTSGGGGRFLIRLGFVFLAVGLRSPAATAQCEWAEGLFALPGVNGQVRATAVFNDGGGDALYIAGDFTLAGDVAASYIARWDGSSWSALGSEPNDVVVALAVFDDGGGPALYAGGELTSAGGASANYIAKWDGASWTSLGSGLNGVTLALSVFDDGGGPALYAGGNFSTAGGAGADRVAKWDGASWSALGSGISTIAGEVNALAVFDDGGGPALYAGGFFDTAGGMSANNIAKWDGSIWSALGSGITGSAVFALSVFDDGGGPALYAGGNFSTAGGGSANHIAQWNGSTWTALGSGMNGEVRALLVFDDGDSPALYAGGSFNTAGGASANFMASWDGLSWSALGAGMSGTVLAMSGFDDGGGPALYVGGAFIAAGGIGADRIARWDGLTWSVLGSNFGMSHVVETLAVFDDGGGPALYAAGDFTIAGDVIANFIARWNGSTWSALDAGMAGTDVQDLAVFDDGGGPALYAGGFFFTAGGLVANDIAEWDGASWSPLGSGMTGGGVFALSAFDDGGGPALYAGGFFTAAGGVSANSIARWNGSNWSALGLGTEDVVFALSVFDDGGGPALYAGGFFTTVGGVSASNIAKWNGSSWSALGSGLDSDVYALAVFDDGGGPALYAGGDFSTAGGASANNIAKWNGSSWSALGSGIEGNAVLVLSVFDDGGDPALYAGGNFTTAGGASANHIAKWNGSTWSALGSGMNNYVSALSAFDDGSSPALYAGGDFTTAGGNVSVRIAKWDCTADCNGNLIPDADDIANCPPATPACADCNGNGVPDECDIAGPASEDCNANGVPDECDISGCNPDVDPSCDDCNLNGAPDGCDIAALTSNDDDLDGVPDECAQFVGGCPPGQEELWSCPQNWILEDPGDDYPDNVQFGGPFHVVLDGTGPAADDVILDVLAQINTLLLRDNATLHVLDLGGPGPAGDELVVTDAGGVSCEADLLVSGASSIDASAGVFHAAAGGFYGRDPDIADPASATLVAGTLEILEGPPGQAGTMELGGSMSANILGGAVLFGGDDDCSPPILRSSGSAAMAVGGAFTIIGGAEIDYASSAPLVIGGDFVNESTDSTIFDWLAGSICLGICAPDFAGPPSTHTFEVAGRDLGPQPAGYGLNFAVGTLTVGGAASATFTDAFDNDGMGQAPCTEALYVKHLILEDAATVTLSGVNVYYLTLDDFGATINAPGCGTLQPVPPAAPPPGGLADCADLDDDDIRDDNCLWWTADADGACVAQTLVFADMGGSFGACSPDGAADGSDRFHTLNCFSDSNTAGLPGYPCEDSPPAALNVDAGAPFGGCVPDGVCDGNDAFHALNAFSNATTCICPNDPIAPAPAFDPGPPGPPAAPRTAVIDLRLSSKRIRPGDLVDVDVILASPLDDLRGYQLHLGVSGGESGALELVDISIREPGVLQGAKGPRGQQGQQGQEGQQGRQPAHRPRLALRQASSGPGLSSAPDPQPSTLSFWSAFNLHTHQMVAGLDGPGVAAPAGSYLATFTYRAGRRAEGRFVIELLADSQDPAQRTFLFATDAALSPPVAGPVAVRVQVVRPQPERSKAEVP